MSVPPIVKAALVFDEKSSVWFPVIPVIPEDEPVQLTCAFFIPLVFSMVTGRFTVPLPEEESGFKMIMILSSIGFAAPFKEQASVKYVLLTVLMHVRK